MILVGEREIHVCMSSISQQGFCKKDHAKGWNSLLRVNLAIFQKRPFTICGNPNSLVFLGQHGFNNLLSFEPANLEKRWLYIDVGQPQKMLFSIEKSIFR